ncbi:hypothetical protein N0V93_007375 [Gnomoniopsis smithogilvyi]|uniref:Uncharacterized protein n=1 Tax=Gnomoniopsis smithogilvyi TaxID=1191159 RepID=A0A9W8YPY9_9PEZI|nr:hypothetical protein N0V93_007375 [Gnomoniopsis smithogilvyi]
MRVVELTCVMVRSQQPNGRIASPPSIPSSTRPARGASGCASSVPEDVQFALETLHNLTTHCPNWAKRLDELSDQIDQRQIDLARCAEQYSPCNRSLRNRGSTESLKPKDDGEAHLGADGRLSPEDALAAQEDCKRISGFTNTTTQNDCAATNGANSPTSSAVERQKSQVAAAATAKARAALRRSQLGKRRSSATESINTGDGPAMASKYRSKSLVIVYYDSYVQSFFEEVVKFVSASRNLMRKAKMAAKVAQIKRMAELEMPDDDSSEGSVEGFGNGNVKFLPPQLSPSEPNGAVETTGKDVHNADTKSDQCATDAKPANGNTDKTTPAAITPSRISIPQTNGNGTSIPSPLVPGPFRPSMAAWTSISPQGKASDTKEQPSILDKLDKSLEIVQSMCEHAAHQFLRDGDCSDEIVNIKERLMATKTAADKEQQRMLDNDVDGSLKKLVAEGGLLRNRMYHPQITRRDMARGAAASPRLKTSFAGGGSLNGGATPSANLNGTGSEARAPPALEVDDSIVENEATIANEPPKFDFRSTRAMGPRVADGP